jgi:Holliday junction resolvase RusA-like endonuclease
MTTPLSFTVTGTPAPQGSHRAFVVNGRAVVTHDSKKTRPWRQDVRQAALDAITARVAGQLEPGWAPFEGPLHVTITFRLPRPGYHYGTGKNANRLKPTAPTFVEKKPDLDKLIRATLDALGEAGVWRDDAQVARLIVEKEYATTTPPGADVMIRPLTHDAVPAVTSTPAAGTATTVGALF